jgi:ketosteroid isomerase-like protein
MKSIANTTTRLATVLVLAAAPLCLADPPAGEPSGTQPAETQGGMLSSLKQALAENLDRDQVRGHFDVGAPPAARRYYCLVDPKTGKRESNGVSGETVQRRDGTTGVKSAVVSPLSCADAEQKGLLDTADYKLTGKAATAANPPAAAPAAPAAPAPAVTAAPAVSAAAAAPAVVPTAPAPAAGAPSGTPDDADRREVMGVYARFILAQNAHDAAALADVLLDSKDFVWGQEGGGSIFGSQEALAAFEQAWKGTWRLDPQAQGSRVASPAPGVAVLVAPLLLTSGAARKATAVRLRWSGVFVQTPAGWRIASIFVTPY